MTVYGPRVRPQGLAGGRERTRRDARRSLRSRGEDGLAPPSPLCRCDGSGACRDVGVVVGRRGPPPNLRSTRPSAARLLQGIMTVPSRPGCQRRCPSARPAAVQTPVRESRSGRRRAPLPTTGSGHPLTATESEAETPKLNPCRGRVPADAPVSTG